MDSPEAVVAIAEAAVYIAIIAAAAAIIITWLRN